jgi:hypothetical protein
MGCLMTFGGDGLEANSMCIKQDQLHGIADIVEPTMKGATFMASINQSDKIHQSARCTNNPMYLPILIPGLSQSRGAR